METPLFRKILFPLQFDRIAIPALEMVSKLANGSDRFAYLLCVIPEATHGRTGENYEKLGSVTEQVVRESTRPVLTIRSS
jgi:hypothetical protein